MSHLTKEYLRDLKLPTMASQYEKLAQEAETKNLSYEKYLGCLAEMELDHRKTRRVQSRLKAAKFPVVKTLEVFDFKEVPELNKKELLKLHDGEFVSHRENIIFIGPPGTGKTHLVTSLGVEVCKLGKHVRFYTAAGLMNVLTEAQNEHRLSRVLTMLASVDLLIIDDLGYIPCSQSSAQLLFQLFSERYQKGAIIVTTNLEFSAWTDIFLEKRLTAALLDRLTHQAHIFALKAESYRFKHSLKKKGKTSLSKEVITA